MTRKNCRYAKVELLVKEKRSYCIQISNFRDVPLDHHAYTGQKIDVDVELIRRTCRNEIQFSYSIYCFHLTHTHETVNNSDNMR